MNDEKITQGTRVEDVLGQIIGDDALHSSDTTSDDVSDTARGADIPSEAELADMTADERRALYQRLALTIDAAVDDRTRELAQQYDKEIGYARDTSVKQVLSSSERFGGFGENIAAIDGIIDKVPVLSTLPSEQKYTLAYLINEGLNARKSKMGMSAEAIVSLVNSRPDALNLLEAQRARELHNAYAQTPAFSASSGTASMPANIKSAPRNLDEASREAYSSFGIKI